MIESIVLAGALLAGPAAAGSAVTTLASEIPARWQPFAACVSQRESKGNYRARNTSGVSTAQGRWQFLDSAWRVRGGIEWIVVRQLKKHGASWAVRKRVYERLSQTPIYRWPSWAQDAAFVGVVTERSTGWKHWSLSGSRCQGMVPAGAQ